MKNFDSDVRAFLDLMLTSQGTKEKNHRERRLGVGGFSARFCNETSSQWQNNCWHWQGPSVKKPLVLSQPDTASGYCCRRSGKEFQVEERKTKLGFSILDCFKKKSYPANAITKQMIFVTLDSYYLKNSAKSPRQ